MIYLALLRSEELQLGATINITVSHRRDEKEQPELYFLTSPTSRCRAGAGAGGR